MQRSILFDLKDEIVPPTNETVTQVFARLSAYRDAMDGPQVSISHVHHSLERKEKKILHILASIQ